MIEELCNIWDKYDEGYIVCITTNGYVKKNGCAVMGRGVAKQALERFPNLDKAVGESILSEGNCVAQVIDRIVTFPVKPVAGQCLPSKLNVVAHLRHHYKPFGLVPGWAMKADFAVIEHSMIQLQQIYSVGMFATIYLPRPGCGAGGLLWEEVKPIVEQYSSGGDNWLIACDLPQAYC